MKHLYLIAIFVLCNLFGFSQHTIIPTGTVSPIHEIEFAGDSILILGKDGFFAKCNGDCSELINRTTPGYAGYSRNDLMVLAPDTYYLISHKDFPHHGYVLKSENGGDSWEVVLDTNDILFTSFFMFDESYGSIITTFYRSILTSNSGETWTEESHGLIGSSASLKINDSTAVMGVTEDFNFTTDKGVTWQSTSFPQSPPTSFFAEHPDSIFAVTYGGTGCFFTYCFSPGESSWTKENITDFIPLGLYVRGLEEVYVIGQFYSSGTGGILKTTNLGETWSFYDTGIEGSLYEIEFLNDTTALIGGSEGLLMKWSTNSHFEMVSIKEYSSKINMSLAPNPAYSKQTLTVELNNDMDGTIVLTDLQGRFIYEVYSGKFIAGVNKISVDINDIPSGTYIYTITVNGIITRHIKWIKI